MISLATFQQIGAHILADCVPLPAFVWAGDRWSIDR